jgi:hypothetical protein
MVRARHSPNHRCRRPTHRSGAGLKTARIVRWLRRRRWERGAGATPRAATFSGGWAVAYDLPAIRSAFGVAGTGATIEGHIYDQWPNRIEWADGSFAEYGLEGGTGPNHLAYLRIAGQRCLYNVWSRLGQEHLEFLLEQLRFVVPDAR